MTRKLNNPITALTALAAFLWLGWYGYHAPQGYTDAQRAAMARLVASVNKPAKHLTADNAAKMVYLWGGSEHE